MVYLLLVVATLNRICSQFVQNCCSMDNTPPFSSNLTRVVSNFLDMLLEGNSKYQLDFK